MTLRTLLRSRRARVGLVAAAGLALSAGCAAETPEPPHPVDRLSYPVSVTADPDGRVVWVTSGNFDLRFEGGAVLAIDAVTHQFIPSAAFQVGGFPGPFGLLTRGGGDRSAIHGYVASREDDALYHVAIEGTPAEPTVSCPGGERASSGILICPEAQALDRVEVTDSLGEDAVLRVGPDPFGVLVRQGRFPGDPDLLLTAAMIDGNAATFALADDGTPALVGNLDLADGLYGFAESPVTGRIFASTKNTNLLQILQVTPPAEGSTPNPLNPFLSLVGQVSIPAPVGTDHGRELAVSHDGQRLYVAYRAPNSVAILGIGQSAQGQPQATVLTKVPTCVRPGGLVVAPPFGPLPELVYVSCFDSERIEVIDPALGQVVDIIRTGDGPFGMSLMDNEALGLRRLYVANFRSQTVGVVELQPDSPYFHVQVAEIR